MIAEIILVKWPQECLGVNWSTYGEKYRWDGRTIQEAVESLIANKDYKNNISWWLIWSIEHNAWWRPEWKGYTKDRKEAGVYTYEEALKIVADANIRLGDVPNEAMIRFSVEEE